MGIGRIRFIQNADGLWYWQFLNDQLVVLGEGVKLVDNLEVCATQAGLVCGLAIELSFEEADFGVMKSLFVQRTKPIGIEVRMFDATKDGVSA